MKVLHIISSLKVGGAESLLVQLIPALEKKGFENHVIYFHEGPNADKLRDAGVKVYRIWGKFWKYDSFFFIKLYKLIKQIRPSYIHTHLWFANVVSSLFGYFFKIPVVHTLHLISNSEQKGSLNFFRTVVDRFIFKLPNKFVLVNQDMAGQFSKHYAFVPAKKVNVILNGIDVESVRSQGLSSMLPKKEGLFTFGSVGRLIERKNFAGLINAFACLDKINGASRLLIIGHGPQKQDLQELIFSLRLEDKVKIISDNSAYKYYPLMDVYISLSYEEGLSIAMLEAMAFSLPLILQSENKNHVFTSNSLIVKDQKEAPLAMLKLVEDKLLKDSLAEQSCQLVSKKYSLERVAQEYADIYEL